MQQHLAAGFQGGRFDAPLRIMADAAFAEHDDHPGRHDPARLADVVAGTGDNVLVSIRYARASKNSSMNWRRSV